MCKAENPKVNAIILVGVSGCGKTTISLMLADRLEWDFIESDDYHSSGNVHKMSSNIPLTDEDRQPWLNRLHRVLRDRVKLDQPAILACSALKESYRKILKGNLPGIFFVYLKGDFTLIHERMTKRKGHFMKADMLRSQFEALEIPDDALSVDINQPPQAIIEKILTDLKLD